jgi:hypothetical protein
MSINHNVQASITWKQVAAFRLRRQHLFERAPAGALVPVVNTMAGAQAQLISAAQISLWSRIRDLQVAQIEEALIERTLVKAACMRRTLFLVPSEHLATFVRGSARRAEKEIHWALGKGVSARNVDAAIEAALDALDEPLTRREIAERVSKSLGVQMQIIPGGGWGSRRGVAAVPVGELIYPVVDLLHLAAARGVFCYGPNRGNELTFVRADTWIPHWQDIPVEQAEGLLLRRYLQAFGPATTADFALWTGISLTGAREIWAKEQAYTAPVNIQGWQASILGEDLGDLAQAAPKRTPVRLLPSFDTYLLGHKERQHLVAEEQRAKVYRSQGWIAPVVLINGRIGGVWEHRLEGGRLQVRVRAFIPFPRRVANEVYAEAQDLGRFLGIPNIDLQMD